MRSFVPYQREIVRATQHLEGMTEHPGLTQGMPYSRAAIEAKLEELLTSVHRLRQLRSASKQATSRMSVAFASLHAQLQANVVYAASRLGPDSAELRDLGGNPRRCIVPPFDRTIDPPLDPVEGTTPRG